MRRQLTALGCGIVMLLATSAAAQEGGVELVRTGRVRLNANQTREFSTLMPGGYARIRFGADIAGVDFVSPAKTFEFKAEYSADGGATWVYWGGFVFRGHPNLQPSVGDPVNGHPWIEVPVPPAGSDLRLTLINLGERVDLGYIVTAYPAPQ